jgi:hypothetical protein
MALAWYAWLAVALALWTLVACLIGLALGRVLRETPAAVGALREAPRRRDERSAEPAPERALTSG